MPGPADGADDGADAGGREHTQVRPLTGAPCSVAQGVGQQQERGEPALRRQDGGAVGGNARGVAQGRGVGGADGGRPPPAKKVEPIENLRSTSTLIDAAKQGDRDAFGELIARYRKDVRWICWNFLRNPGHVDDAEHDCWVNVHKGLKDVNSQTGNFSNWLKEVARNLCRDLIKKRIRHERLADDLKYAQSPELVQQAEIDEDLMKVKSALENADPDTAAAFYAYYVDGESYADLARIMGITVEALRMRFSRLRERVRKAPIVRQLRDSSGGES